MALGAAEEEKGEEDGGEKGVNVLISSRELQGNCFEGDLQM